MCRIKKVSWNKYGEQNLLASKASLFIPKRHKNRSLASLDRGIIEWGNFCAIMERRTGLSCGDGGLSSEG